MAKDAVVSQELADKFRTEKDFGLPALRAQRRARHHRRPLRAKPAHGRIETVAAPRHRRQGRLHQSRGVALFQRLLRLRNRARPKARTDASSLRGDAADPERPRLDHGVERHRRPHHLRMEGRRDLRHSAELLISAFQRLRPGRGELRGGDQRAVGDQPLRRSEFHFQLSVRFQEPLFRRAGLFQLQGRAGRLPACAPISCPTPSTCR